MHLDIQKQHVDYYKERLKWIASEKAFALKAYPDKRHRIETWARQEYEKCLVVVEMIGSMNNFDNNKVAPEPKETESRNEPSELRINHTPRRRKFYGGLWESELKRILTKPMNLKEIFHQLVETDTVLLKEAVGQRLKTREEKIRQLDTNLSTTLHRLVKKGVLNERV
jgi:hypothetical protein